MPNDPKEKKPRTGGKPEFDPTQDQRQKVLTWTGYGMGQREIAKLIINPHTQTGISRTTLRKHFRTELETGQAIVGSQVVESLFRQAVGVSKIIRVTQDQEGNPREEVVREAVAPNASAAIYWTKAQRGWMEERERRQIEIRMARMELEKGRLDIARKLLELKGVVDENEDPQEVARQIKAAVDEIMGVTSASPDA